MGKKWGKKGPTGRGVRLSGIRKKKNKERKGAFTKGRRQWGEWDVSERGTSRISCNMYMICKLSAGQVQ